MDLGDDNKGIEPLCSPMFSWTSNEHQSDEYSSAIDPSIIELFQRVTVASTAWISPVAPACSRATKWPITILRQRTDVGVMRLAMRYQGPWKIRSLLRTSSMMGRVRLRRILVALMAQSTVPRRTSAAHKGAIPFVVIAPYRSSIIIDGVLLCRG